MRQLLLLLCILLPLLLPARTIYVVSVGIAKYQYITPLRQTENDATDMAALYRTHTTHVTLLTGKNATRQSICTTLRKVFAQAEADDVVVFFFSGHGSKGGLCAYDTRGASTCISYGEIAKIIKGCRANNKLLFIDACYAGGLRHDSNAVASAQSSFDKTEGVMLFLSSRTNETSRENPYGRNGQFTRYLLRGLKGGADNNRNRIVEAKELFDFVAVNVAKATKGKQHPVMWGRFDNNMHVMNWNPKR